MPELVKRLYPLRGTATCLAWKCTRLCHTRGFCEKHYRRALRGESPGGTVRKWVAPYVRKDGRVVAGHWKAVKAPPVDPAKWAPVKPGQVDKGPCRFNARCKGRAKWKDLCLKCYWREYKSKPEVKQKVHEYYERTATEKKAYAKKYAEDNREHLKVMRREFKARQRAKAKGDNNNDGDDSNSSDSRRPGIPGLPVPVVPESP